MTVIPGSGNDPSNFQLQTVYLYDSSVFPFYQAELYMQFHEDFTDPAYPFGPEYCAIKKQLLQDGRLSHTQCPTRPGCEEDPLLVIDA